MEGYFFKEMGHFRKKTEMDGELVMVTPFLWNLRRE
jgi:hypothetical protein